MSFQHRVFSVTALLLVTSVVGARAQNPAPAPRREFFRLPRVGYNRFEYRVPRFEYRLPRLSMRVQPRIRLNRSELGRRIMERSLDRMNRTRELRFRLQDRVWRRQLEVQGRAMGRLRERLDRVPSSRPFLYRRHLRTI